PTIAARVCSPGKGHYHRCNQHLDIGPANRCSRYNCPPLLILLLVLRQFQMGYPAATSTNTQTSTQLTTTHGKLLTDYQQINVFEFTWSDGTVRINGAFNGPSDAEMITSPPPGATSYRYYQRLEESDTQAMKYK